MSTLRLELTLLPLRLAVCRLPPGAPAPTWLLEGVCSPQAARDAEFASIIRTADELSLVAAEERVLAEWQTERGWRCLKVTGPLDFALIGVLASLAAPLAVAGVAIFALSTFDTDYLLVKEEQLAAATAALSAAGHLVR